MQAALVASGMHGSRMSALSMHGTGTPLGDPIEVGAAVAVLMVGETGATGVGGPGAQPLVFASSKSWFGHAEPAAGEMDGGMLRMVTTC